MNDSGNNVDRQSISQSLSIIRVKPVQLDLEDAFKF